MGITKKVSSVILAVVFIVAMIPATVFAANKGWVKSGSDWYYYDASGKMAKGWKQIGKVWYFFDDDYGFMYSDTWRWETNSKGTEVGYYFSKSGAMQKNSWKLLCSAEKDYWTYLKSDGSTAVGWYKIGKKWYFFDDSDYIENPYYACMVTDELIDGKYYVGSDGVMLCDKWQVSESYPGSYTFWHYFDKNGVMVTDCWKQIGKKWYYFWPDGDTACGYSFISSGDSAKIYIFDDFDAYMKTGWIKRGPYWYYAGKDGALYVECKVKIGTKTYEFDPAGHCLNP